MSAPLPEHQVIVVGSNPVPCVVAARALAPRRVTLVTSRDVLHLAQQVADELMADGFAVDAPLVEIREPSDAGEIQKAVAAINGLGAAGLHYTGGKKTMAVHAYVAWIAARGGDRSEATYLDAQTGALRFDDLGVSVPLHLEPRISFDSLTRLHRITPVNPSKPDKRYRRKPPIPGLAAAVARSAAELDLAAFREVWPPVDDCDHRIPPDQAFLGPHQLHGTQDISKYRHIVEFFEASAPYAFHDFARHYFWRAKGLTGDPGKDKLKDAYKWLEGEWLEEYTWAALDTISHDAGIHDVLLDIKMKTLAGAEFQVDVGCMLGHVFFAFSCTVGSAEAKLKLFEAHARATQLGGDHARFALVCLEERAVVDRLSREAQDAWNAPGRYFRVFGREDVLGDFPGALKTWIQSVHEEGA